MKKIVILLAAIALAACSGPEEIKFVQFTDTHIAETTSGETDLRLAVQDVNRMDDIDFVLVSGDLTDMDIDSNLKIVKRVLDSLDVPYYVIPGNHDTKWSGTGGANVRHIWGKDRFVFDKGGYRFIGFHQGPVLRMDDGHVPKQDLTWLEDQINKAGDKPVFIVMHYPLTDGVDNWYEVADILEKGNIKGVIHGHGHRSRQNYYAGIPGLMSRSTLRAGEDRGGYNIYTIARDSLFVRERRTGDTTGSVWAKVDLSKKYKVNHVPDSLRGDMSVNSEFPGVKPEWIYESGYMTTGSPVLDDSLVYFGDLSGELQALSFTDGKLKWKYKTGGAIYTTPAVAGNRIVVTSADSNIYCIDKNSRELLWKVSTGNSLVANPKIDNGTVYVGSSDGIFRSIDLETGEIKWEYDNVKGYVETLPLLYEGKVIFGAWDGRLYALNASDGSEAWIWTGDRKTPMYSPAACYPVGANGKVFIAAPDRYLSAIDVKTGKTVWRHHEWKFRETTGLSEDGSLVFARSMTDSVVAVKTKPSKFKTAWAEDYKYGYDIAPSMPVEKEGTLFWGTKNGMIVAAEAKTGKTKWKHRFENYLINTVEPVNGNKVLFSNIDGKIVLMGEG